MKSILKRTRGFTLIELLVVIAIIGVLASIVLASLNTARLKSRDARRIADLKSIQLALELFFDGFGAGSYPGGTVLTPLSANNYISVVPLDPTTQLPYFYQALVSATTQTACAAAPGCTYYHLGAKLEQPATGLSNGGNPALATDRDLNPAATFPGASIDCVTAGLNDGCYDLTP